MFGEGDAVRKSDFRPSPDLAAAENESGDAQLQRLMPEIEVGPRGTGAAQPQPNRHRILQEATEPTEGMISPRITRINADWM
jgi:hypothetical protein